KSCRDSRTENPETEQRERGEHERHGVIEGGLVPPEPLGELTKQRRADADDDGEHQYLHARRDDVAENALGEEGRLVEQAEWYQHEGGERGELELDERDEELDRQDEEGDEDDQPGDQQHEDLDEVLEERDEAQ